MVNDLLSCIGVPHMMQIHSSVSDKNKNKKQAIITYIILQTEYYFFLLLIFC